MSTDNNAPDTNPQNEHDDISRVEELFDEVDDATVARAPIEEVPASASESSETTEAELASDNLTPATAAPADVVVDAESRAADAPDFEATAVDVSSAEESLSAAPETPEAATATRDLIDDESIAAAPVAGQATDTQVFASEPAVAQTSAPDSIVPPVAAPAAAEPNDGPDFAQVIADAGAHGVGPFSLREATLGGLWFVMMVLSFFPLVSNQFFSMSIWNLGGASWVFSVALPTAAIVLLALRRLMPTLVPRVGSLSIDQFASVAFSVSAFSWVNLLFSGVGSWVVWVITILLLASVALTAFGRFLPVFGDDFVGREEVVAHAYARPALPITPRPATATPAPAPASQAATSAVPSADAPTGAPFAPTSAPAADVAPVSEPVSEPVLESVFEPVTEAVVEPAANADPQVDDTATRAVATAPAATQAFWALAPEDRDIVDDNGLPIFRIGPTAWALVIEDRGDRYVVRHEDGRIGYLTDVSGVVRG